MEDMVRLIHTILLVEWLYICNYYNIISFVQHTVTIGIILSLQIVYLSLTIVNIFIIIIIIFLYIRTATHSHVLRLLKKGGNQPHLLVSQQPPVWDGDNGSLTDHTHEDHTHLALPETRIGLFEEQSKAFKQKVLIICVCLNTINGCGHIINGCGHCY